MVHTRQHLEVLGFQGFVPLESLAIGDVATGQDAHAVVRLSTAPRTFRLANPSGRFKGRNPTVGLQHFKVRGWRAAKSSTPTRRRLALTDGGVCEAAQ